MLPQLKLSLSQSKRLDPAQYPLFLSMRTADQGKRTLLSHLLWQRCTAGRKVRIQQGLPLKYSSAYVIERIYKYALSRRFVFSRNTDNCYFK